MSDAFTDMARDERRARNYHEYLESLFGYLTWKTSKEELIKQAEGVDAVPRGYWGDSTNLADEKNINRAQKLRDKDGPAWISFLRTLEGDTQQKFQSISPFANKLLLSVSHNGGSNYRVDSTGLKSFLESKTPKEIQHRMRLDYVLILDPKALECAEVQVFE